MRGRAIAVSALLIVLVGCGGGPFSQGESAFAGGDYAAAVKHFQ